MKIRCRLMDVPGIGIVLMPEDSDAETIRRLVGEGPVRVQIEARITRLVHVKIPERKESA